MNPYRSPAPARTDAAARRAAPNPAARPALHTMPRFAWSDGGLDAGSIDAALDRLDVAAVGARELLPHLTAVVAASGGDALPSSRAARAALLRNAGALIELWRADTTHGLAPFDVVLPIVAEAAGGAADLDLSAVNITFASPAPVRGGARRRSRALMAWRGGVAGRVRRLPGPRTADHALRRHRSLPSRSA